MTQKFINKVEHSFSTLCQNNGKFGIFESLVEENLNGDAEKEQILDTVHKILDLFNTSSAEQQKVLFNSEISDVINMIK